jgi:hypothetical protein
VTGGGVAAVRNCLRARKWASGGECVEVDQEFGQRQRRAATQPRQLLGAAEPVPPLETSANR